MKPFRFHCVALLVLLAAAATFFPDVASAQKSKSRLTPLVVNPAAESIASSMLLKNERVDLSTITRDDRTLRVGSELVQGESVTTIRTVRDTSLPDTYRQRREAAIREQDDTRHKREAAIFDD